jgi:hypothetical protein
MEQGNKLSTEEYVMPQRAIGLFGAIFGLVAVVGLAIVGIDAARSAKSGPVWKRRLLTAGLVLMTALGFSSSSKAEPLSPNPAPAAGQAKVTAPTGDLHDNPAWNQITAAWKDAAKATSGPVEDYPFDAEEKKLILAGLKTATENVAALETKGLVNGVEANLLRKELASLESFVQFKRERIPIETTPEIVSGESTSGIAPSGIKEFKIIMSTCYDMAEVPTPEYRGVRDLSDQLPLLEKLAALKKLDAPAVRKILETVEKQLAGLDRNRNAVLMSKVATQVKRIKAALGEKTVSLEDSPGWKALTLAWKEAEAVGSGKRGDYPFDEAGKKKLLDSLAKADADLAKLQSAGTLGGPETSYLRSELKLLVQGVQSKRPTEMRHATCYEPMDIPSPSKQALDRIEERLPLMQMMAESKTMSPAVAATVVSTILRDIEAVSKAGSDPQLSHADQARVAKAKHDASEALRRLSVAP